MTETSDVVLRPATDAELMKLLAASRQAVVDAEAVGLLVEAEVARERSVRYHDELILRMRACLVCQDPDRCCSVHRTHVAPHQDCS